MAKRWILKIEQEGDGAVVRFPDDLVQDMQVKDGDEIEIEFVADGVLVKRPVRARESK